METAGDSKLDIQDVHRRKSILLHSAADAEEAAEKPEVRRAKGLDFEALQ